MNRRDFTKSIAAAATLPVLPIPLATTSTPTVTTSSIRWAAIYLSNLQGKFTPEMLTRVSGLRGQAATNVINQLVAENLITPAHAAGQIAVGRAIPLPKAQVTTKHPTTLERLTNHLDTLDSDDNQIDETHQKDDHEDIPNEQA